MKPAKSFLLAGTLYLLSITSFGQAILAPTLLTAQDGLGNGNLLQPVGTNVYFIGTNNGLAVGQLWRTDGTVAGTQQLTNYQRPVHYHMATSGSTFYHTELIQLNNQGQYYKHSPTSGTDAAVTYTGQQDEMAYGIALGNELVFPSISQGLCITDGSNAPKRLLDMTLAVASKCTWGKRVFFGAMTRGTESNIELYVTDGTAIGSKLVKDIWPGANSGHPKNLTVIGEKLYFTAESKVAGVRELWVSDGTSIGTKFVAKLGKTEISGPMLRLKPDSPKFYFVTNVGGSSLDPTSKSGLWESDGTTAGTRQLTFSTAPSGFFQLLPMQDGKVRLFANDPANVRSIYYVTPGATASAPWSSTVVQYIPQGQPTNPMALVNGKIFYAVGDKMWAWSNTGFAQVRPTNTQSSWSIDINQTGSWVVNSDWLYFIANANGGGKELYKVR
ncbi:MAG: hypothetical protein JNL43_04440 [Flavobacteriales bacterium]|nr:hypothetical protein [Flavobacteriales bacterium]